MDVAAEIEAMRMRLAEVERIRSWRDQTRHLYDRPSTPADSDAVANTIGWWRDVDTLLDMVRRLSAAVVSTPPPQPE